MSVCVINNVAISQTVKHTIFFSFFLSVGHWTGVERLKVQSVWKVSLLNKQSLKAVKQDF